MRQAKPERITVRVESDLRKYIKALARKRRVDEADVIREILWEKKDSQANAALVA